MSEKLPVNTAFLQIVYSKGILLMLLKRRIMETIKLRDEFIKLGQALKAAGLVESGVEAKIVIQDGLVTVNGNVETQRGKKLVGGEVVGYNGQEIKIER